MCCEKHCIHERIVISFLCLQSSKKFQKLNVCPQNLQRSFRFDDFHSGETYKSPKVTKIISKPKKPAIWYVTQCSLKKKTCHILVPFFRSHSSKAQYWQCGCLGDDSSNGSLYMVRGCIISFIVNLRRWIFKVFGNTFVSGCNVHGEGVLIFKNVSVYHKCKQYFLCIVKFLTWKIKWLIKKIQCSFVNN